MADELLAFGSELRRRRIGAGLSLTDLAKLVHYSKSHLSKVENGLKPPSLGLARQCDAVLAGDEPLAGLVRSTSAEVAPPADAESGEVWVMTMTADGRSDFAAVSRRDLLLAGVSGIALWTIAPVRPPELLDEDALASFRTIFDEVRKLNQAVNPAAVMPVLVTQTHALRVTASSAKPAVRDKALVLASRFAELTGWVAQESGDDRRALWWTRQAVELAAAGGDSELRAYGLVRHALVAMYRHDAVATIALAQQARAQSTRPRIRGLAALREAQGHALAGDYGSCRRTLDVAAVELAAAASEPAGGPVLGTSTVADPLAMVTGWCLLDLGRPAAAAAILRAEIDRLPATAVRARARFGTRLALAYAVAGEVERACLAAEPIVAVASTIDSATVRVDLTGLRQALRRWPVHPAVQAVLPRLTAALRSGPLLA